MEGVSTDQYRSTYGIEQLDDGVKLGFVTGSNVGSRLYLLDDDMNYKMFYLKNREFAIEVDVSQVFCGMNGAMYFVEMDKQVRSSSSSVSSLLLLYPGQLLMFPVLNSHHYRVGTIAETTKLVQSTAPVTAMLSAHTTSSSLMEWPTVVAPLVLVVLRWIFGKPIPRQLLVSGVKPHSNSPSKRNDPLTPRGS